MFRDKITLDMNEEELREKIKDTVRKYLTDPSLKVFVFGSRANSTNRKWSDIDIGILGKQKIHGSVIVKIEEELENSKIPYLVDIVDLSNVSEQFRSVALKNALSL